MLAVIFRESIQVGTTQLSPQRVQQVVQEMGETYKGNAYHLLQRNCNHFSNDLCQQLTGQQAPLWVSPMQHKTCNDSGRATSVIAHLLSTVKLMIK